MSNTELYYQEYGDGEALVLLHGNGEDSSYFEKQIKPFSKTRRVITVDTRGHGRSPRGDKPFTFDVFADDLAALFRKIGIERADILGFSDGGNIAIVFALKYPQMVRGLILNGANLYPEGLKPFCLAGTVISYAFFVFASAFSEKAVKKREMYHLMVHQPSIKDSELENIGAKSLVLVGTHDLIRESHSKKIARLIPDCRFVKIPGPHAIARLNAPAYNSAVTEFLKIIAFSATEGTYGGNN